ncbi:MAG: TolC family protein [Candidatus Obscuribacterales bacterium]|nr:TolC family protein [Candidatus Obscuribacterales bacterium]
MKRFYNTILNMPKRRQQVCGKFTMASLLICATATLSIAQPIVAVAQTKQTLNKETRDPIIASGQVGKPVMPAMPNIMPANKESKSTTSAPQNSTSESEEVPTLPEMNTPESRSADTKLPEYMHSPAMNTGSVEYNAVPAGAETLPLPSALREAIKSGPRATAIRAKLGITQAGIATATQAPNTVYFSDRGLMAEQVNRIGPVFMMDMPWELFLRVLAAKRLVDQTKVDLLTSIWSLRADVRKAYVELVVAQETQRTLRQLYDLSAKLYTVSQKRFDAGAVPELDVLKGHLAASQANVDVAVGLKRIAKAKQQLNILIGRPINAPLFVPSLPDYTKNEPLASLRAQKSDILPDFTHEISPLSLFIEKALQSRLELKSLGIQLKVNSANRAVNLANIAPDPSFALGKDTAGNEPSGPKITAVFFTVNQEIPFTNVQQGGIYQYKATGKQLQFQIESQKNQVYSDVSGAYQRLVASREKMRVYQERLLRDSNEVARLAQRSYEVGQSDITAALLAQQANIQVRSAYLDAMSNYASAFTDLEQAVGRPLQ